MASSSHGRTSIQKKIKKNKHSSSDSNTSIQSLSHDILLKIFSNLDHFLLIRCSSVCKFWYDCIDNSTILQKKYDRQKLDFPELFTALRLRPSSSSGATLKSLLRELAMQQHRMSFRNESVGIFQWEGHSSRVDQCRMKMGRILTGVGDKVVRVWSLESYKCLEEYSVPGMLNLADVDFDESKVVGLLGSRICIWRRNGKRTIFPSPYEKVTSGLCMRYVDPEAVVGCGDGAARVYDMYSKKCTRIIRMHDGPVTCLALSDDHLILSGSSLGSIKLVDLSSDQRVSSLRSTTTSTGITTLCYNPSSSLVFAGSTAGYLHCWDLRTMKELWENRVSPNMIYSVQHMQNDNSSVVTGGIDGVLRIVNQGTGEIISRYVIGEGTMRLGENGNGGVERTKGRMILKEQSLDSIPKYRRPAITCLAVGMQKVITTHNSKVIRVWKFDK